MKTEVDYMMEYDQKLKALKDDRDALMTVVKLIEDQIDRIRRKHIRDSEKAMMAANVVRYCEAVKRAIIRLDIEIEKL